MSKSKKWHGYTFSRLAAGVLAIQRRAALRAWNLDDCGAAANVQGKHQRIHRRTNKEDITYIHEKVL
jgi:membrane protein required for beta-lactamase induction